MSKFSKILNKQNQRVKEQQELAHETELENTVITPLQRRTANGAYNGISLQRLDVDLIDHSPYQPRFMSATSRDALQELADNIRQHGQINPILVRPKKGRYELIGGERRLYAIKEILKLKDIDCLIKDIGDEKAAVTALVDNINRTDLSDYEIACAIKLNCQKFGYPIDQAEFISEKFNISRNKYYRLISLFDLPEFIHQTLIEHPKILSGSAASLLKTAVNKANDLIGREQASELLAQHWQQYVNDYLENTKISTQFIKDFETSTQLYFDRIKASDFIATTKPVDASQIIKKANGDSSLEIDAEYPKKPRFSDTQLTLINQHGKKIGSLKCNESLKGKKIVSIRLSIDDFDDIKMQKLQDFLQQLEQ